MSLKFALLISTILISIAPTCFAQSQSFEFALSEMSTRNEITCEVNKITLDVARTSSRGTKKDQEESIYLAEMAVRMACECLPRQLTSFRAKFSKADLKQTVSKEAFQEKVLPVLGRCVGEQFQVMFATSCPEQFSKEVISNKGFCQCMSSKFAAMSDTDIANMTLDATQDFERRVEARTKGLPPPKQTEWNKKRTDMESACAAQP